MNVPNADQIETAVENIPKLTKFMVDHELGELHEAMGTPRLKQFGLEELTVDFRNGYLLGIETARVILATSAALAIANVKPEDVL